MTLGLGESGNRLDDLSFAAYEINHLPSLPLLVQTGYLSIRSSETYRDRTRYRLGFPNREVENAFAQYCAGGSAHEYRAD